MNVWFSILKKELRMQRGVALGILAALVLIGSLSLWLAFTKGPVSVILLLIPLFLHAFFLPIYMLNSVQKEWKHTSSTFLQMPLSGWKLLSAKLVSGLIYFFASFTLTFLICVITFRIGLDSDSLQQLQSKILDTDSVELLATSWGLVGRTYLFALLNVLYANLTLVPLMAFFSVVVQWMRNTIRRAAGFLTFLICVGSLWLLALFTDTSIYDTLTNWGEFTYPIQSLTMGPYFAGKLVFDLLLSVGLFLFVGWLIDRKVEV